MQKGTKYTIMKREMKGTTLQTLKLSAKLLIIYNKVKQDKISIDDFQNEMFAIFDKLLPIQKKASHLLYETLKDIENIDEQRLVEYLKINGISPFLFNKNYNEAKKQMTKSLLMFAIFDKNDIQFPVFENPDKALQLLNGDIIENIVGCLDNKDNDLFEKITDENFTIEDLSENELQLVEDYHNNYMFGQIQPYVSQKPTEKEILKKVKPFGKFRFGH